jgi:anti-anti-sigma regulatory factor
VVASSLLAKMRPALEKASRPFRDEHRSLDALMAETLPFVESAVRAGRDATPERTSSWREARSFAWLLAYRLGDQGWPGPVVSAVAPAWRDAIGTDWGRQSADELHALLLEGYARGREERARTEAQKGLAAALPVAEIAPGVVVIIAAGPLDPDGATALADRASSFLLRRDARAALLDITGVVNPSGAVLVELWAIPSSARMLGVRMVVSGVGGLVGEVVAQAHLHDEGETRVVTLADGVTKLLESANVAIGGQRGFGAWVKSLLAKR